jgi:hypothetical protein
MTKSKMGVNFRGKLCNGIRLWSKMKMIISMLRKKGFDPKNCYNKL